jgi:neutral ceramidase
MKILVPLWQALMGLRHPLTDMEELKRYPLFPTTLPLQLVRIGDLALVAAPFELTTVAGRRLREAVDTILRPVGVREVVIAGLANDYANYVATPQEYQLQYYEGASTLFGVWTLDALRQEFRMLAGSLRSGRPVRHGPEPVDTIHDVDTARLVLPRDSTPGSIAFGAVESDADSSYEPGKTAKVRFWGGNPDNDLRTQDTFLEVQRDSDGSWVTVARDWDWQTAYRWEPHSPCPSRTLCSLVTIEWAITKDVQPGIYRIVHYGNWRGSQGRICAYMGKSREFRVTAANPPSR